MEESRVLTEADLVSFGNYLLRKVEAKAHGTDGQPIGQREVSDADLANWKEEEALKPVAS